MTSERNHTFVFPVTLDGSFLFGGSVSLFYVSDHEGKGRFFAAATGGAGISGLVTLNGDYPQPLATDTVFLTGLSHRISGSRVYEISAIESLHDLIWSVNLSLKQ